MHAGFPCLSREVNWLMRFGAEKGKVAGLLDRAAGTFLAEGMAKLLEAGFCFVMRGSLFNRSQARKAEAFFLENFEIRDPDAPNGIRYYQGKILLRTDKPEDDMNVYLQFCPDPRALFRRGLLGAIQKKVFGTALDSSAVVSAQALKEEEAEELQENPDKVDIVFRFRDVKSIVGLVGRPDIDAGTLLIENVVQVVGNVGHLFKFGAIAKNVELALDPN